MFLLSGEHITSSALVQASYSQIGIFLYSTQWATTQNLHTFHTLKKLQQQLFPPSSRHDYDHLHYTPREKV